jgi:REP element-mobilizing transposase RayT
MIGGEKEVNPAGQMATWLASQYPYLELDQWVIMSNHFHYFQARMALLKSFV